MTVQTIQTRHETREEAQHAVWDARRRDVPAFLVPPTVEGEPFLVHYQGGPEVEHFAHPESPGVTCWCGEPHVEEARDGA